MQPSNVHSHPSHRHGRATCLHTNSYIFPALSRTRVTMQRLLHGLGTQVLGQVQVASPCNTIFPPITLCSSPHPSFLKLVYTTNSFSPAVLRDSVELEAKGQASAQITTETIVIWGQKDKKNKQFWCVVAMRWFLQKF